MGVPEALDQYSQILAFEAIVARGLETQHDVDAATSALINVLMARIGRTYEDTGLVDAIRQLSDAGIASSVESAVLLRGLAVEGLLSAADLSRANRFIVDLCERNLPDLCRYLGSFDRRQTFEKLSALESAHDRVCAILAPLLAISGDVDGILSFRQQILGALNHAAVRYYCGPYGAQEIRSKVDIIITKFSRLLKDPALIGKNISECEDRIRDGKDLCAQRSDFFTSVYFSHFIKASEQALAKIVAETRSRIATSIVLRIVGSNTLQKRYPLHEEGRQIIIAIPFRSTGPGVAGSVSVSIDNSDDSLYLPNMDVYLGNVTRGDFSASFEALVMKPAQSVELMVTVQWQETGDLRQKEELFIVEIAAQEPVIDWARLEYLHPYSTEVAKGDDFFGRDDKVKSLSNKIIRRPMESFYVTGQKRIGKTSLALAACDAAKSVSPDVRIDYLLWGRIAYEDPRDSLRELGNRIAAFIFASLPSETDRPTMVFSGSLAPLVSLAELAQRVAPRVKFVIVIDEFDEMHPELYQKGNLAETFFANLRAITTCENICLCLVGGENMPFVMDRQGQKLNKLVPFHLDYFSRDQEWEDFKLLVRKPTEGSLFWHEEAIAEIFNRTNGNPYFAKILCSWAFQESVRERDSYITVDEITAALTKNLPAFDVNSFSHLWMDGIHKPSGERDPDILRRSRALAAIARTLRRGKPLTLANILSSREGLQLSDIEVPPVLNDLVKRRILREEVGRYSFVLPIFGLWLTEVGVTRLLGDALGEELASAVTEAQDRAYVKSEEIGALVKRWPVYQGKRLGTDDVRQWLAQCDSPIDQRLLFSILKAVRFVSEAEIRERLRVLHGIIRQNLPEFIQRRRSDRRTDVIVTYVDGEGKSGQYFASRYAEENKISTSCIFPPSSFSSSLDTHRRKFGGPVALVIIDDIVCTGNSLRVNIGRFIDENSDVLDNIDITVAALYATQEGDGVISGALSSFGAVSIDFRYSELLPNENFAFSSANGIWADDAERDRALALCRDLGATIYPDNPLGYGGQGLLVIFPGNCPNNTLPILHSRSRHGQQPWEPIFPRMTN